jgi:hypothetical protein
MSAEPDLLATAIMGDDPARVRELLREASEADRKHCAQALEPLFDGPLLHPLEGLFALGKGVITPSRHDQLIAVIQAREEAEARRHSAAFVAATLGLVSSLAAARKPGWPSIFVNGKPPWVEPDGTHSYRDREPLTRDLEAIAGVLADRRPSWLGSWVRDLLTARFRFSLATWPMVRELVRLGAISRPDVPEYTTAMVRFLYAVRWSGGKAEIERHPLDGLLASPWLLEDEVWRLFAVPEAGRMLTACIGTREEALASTWEEALVTLSGQGRLDRGRLLDACIAAFLRDFAANQLGWYVRFHDRLAPTLDELAARAGEYLALLAANSTPGISLGQRACGRLLEAGRLPLADFLAASPQALLFPQKGVAVSQLRLVGRVAREPSVRALALATAAEAFGHERLDVQEAALDLIGKLGVPDGREGAVIAAPAQRLAPVLAGRAADLGLLPPQSPGRAVLAAAITVAPAGRDDALPPPFADPAELTRLLTELMEDATDALAVERALGGAVRLASWPASDRGRFGAPLVKRAEEITEGRTRTGDALSSEIARLALAWASVPPSRPPWAVAETLTLIPAARIREACAVIEGGPAGAELLAEPSAADGSVHPDTLLARLATWRGAPLRRFDLEVALLRLPPVDAAFWAAWDKLHPDSAKAARQAFHEGTTQLTLEPVLATAPSGNRHREGRKHVLARITSPRPAAAGGASGCWGVLTDLPLYWQRWELGSRLSPVVASWPLLSPWQPELAAAHLLRPLAECLAPSPSRARPGALAVAGLARSSAPLGPIGHLALLTGLSAAEASVRIAAADVWSQAALAGRLDPRLAADALVTGATGEAFALSRVADAFRHASREPVSALLIARTVFATAGQLDLAKRPNLHLLLELAAEIGAATPLPRPPQSIVAIAAEKGSGKLAVAARRLVER